MRKRHAALDLPLVTLSSVLLCGNALADIVMSDTITVSATSTATVEKGTYVRNGETLITSDAQLATRQQHAAEYDGHTDFTANYTVVLKDDGTLDRDQSTVTFRTLTYTDGGTLVDDQTRFTTLPIPIYEVMLNADKSLASFKFESPNWYPANATGAGLINNLNLFGSIDLNAPGETSYQAQYTSKSSGAIYTYNVTGLVLYQPKPNPAQPDSCADVPGCAPFLAPTAEITPEPSAWPMVLTGLAGTIVLARRRRKAASVAP